MELKLEEQLNDIGARIQIARSKGGFDQQEVAELCSVSQNTIKRYEADGYKAPMPFLITFCKKTGTDFVWLLFGEVSVNPEREVKIIDDVARSVSMMCKPELTGAEVDKIVKIALYAHETAFAKKTDFSGEFTTLANLAL